MTPSQSTPSPSTPPEPPPVPPMNDADATVSDGCLRADAGFGDIIDATLKHPVAVVNRFREGRYGGIVFRLLITTLAAMSVYSIVIASFSGKEQWINTPVKCLCGLMITMAICLPSMHIFACLSGADISFGASASLLVNAMTLSALLLTGFAPVAWVFSQSTNSVYFMGLFHLIFFGISMLFGMKILLRGITSFPGGSRSMMLFWVVIFIITSLQMMTALRPLIGRSPDVLPTEKKFFIEHWMDSASAEDKRM